jgi:hypothetical protein
MMMKVDFASVRGLLTTDVDPESDTPGPRCAPSMVEDPRGMPFKQIAEQLSSDVETVKGWVRL